MTDQLNTGTGGSAAWPPPAGEQAVPQQWATQPGWQQPPSPAAAPQQKSRFGIGVLVGIGIGLAAAAVGLMVVGLIVTLAAPERVGDSALTDVLYNQCGDGDMAACDALYWEAAVDSELEEFAATCGGLGGWVPGGCAVREQLP